MPVSENDIEQVRGFNRFYTKQIGLLREGLLKAPFSLTQARVLYELGRRPRARSSELAVELGLDPGYLSRLLKGFDRQHLIKRFPSPQDRRVADVSLTPAGRAEFERLSARSRAETAQMLSAMGSSQQQRLVGCMTSIRQLLAPSDDSDKTFELRPHKPGDIGWVISRHGELYAQEYGWDSTFEGLVAEIAGRFLTRFDPRCERCWIAERKGERLGSIFLVKGSKTVAKLRLLLVEPSARGMGVGTRLVEECVACARECGYRKLTLWTNDILHAARRIYEQAGFRLVKEEKQRNFGHNLVGQVWELRL
jgi:DNA-binding MarR family transcriptional regulator/GNAT superfamily N-acetyltransferase